MCQIWQVAALAALAVLAFSYTALSADFTGWGYRQKITFSGYDKSEPLANFPALVILPSTVTNYLASTNGYDLRFAGSNETDELNYEVEKWDPTSNSYVWVQVQEIVGTNTYIWAYFGYEGSTSAAPAYATNGSTWSSDYAGVWHLDETSGTHYDSSANANDGVPTNGVTQDATGAVDGAARFDGSDDWITVNDSATLEPSSNATVSVWINILGNGSQIDGAWALTKGMKTSQPYISYGFNYRSDTDVIRSSWGINGTLRDCNSISTFQTNSGLIYVTATFDGNDMKVYLDGVLDNTVSQAGTLSYGLTDDDLHIGTYNGSPFRRFEGIIDEVRVSAATRSSNWIWAAWLNMASNSQFATYDSVEFPTPSNITVIVLSEQNVGVTGATFRGKILSTGDAENPDTYFCWGPSDAGTSSTGSWPNVVNMGTSWTTNDVFGTNLTSFLSGSNYSYRCYVTNSTGEDWSDDSITFTTIGAPVVTNLGAVYGRTDAILRSEVLDAAGDDPTVWFYYWPDAGATSVVGRGIQTGYFDTTWTGLTAGASYHYTILASNMAGTIWTPTNDFTTRTLGESQTWYVSLDGDHSLGLSWATAFTNIQIAIDAGSTNDTVMVSNGTYDITSQITLTNGITLRAANGWQNTVIDAGWVSGRRVIAITNGVLDGFTITRGLYPSGITQGGGVYMATGTVMNCMITNNRAKYGGGIRMLAGTVTNCTVRNGQANDQHGGGIYMSGGLVIDSEILNNICTRAAAGVYMAAGEMRSCRINGNSGGWGAAIYMSGNTTIENCLITGNAGGSYQSGGGGIQMNNAAARVVNTTLADNSTLGAGGGILRKLGVVSNCVVYYNLNAYSGGDDDISGTSSVWYTCSPDLADDPGGTGNISGEPQFVDKDGGDYTLLPGSPCIDAGTNLTDITDDKDFASRPKDGDDDGSAGHDMGCYETAAYNGGSFRCNFIAATNEGVGSLSAVFTAYVFGPNTNSLYYWWDFENDSSDDQEGSTKRTVTNNYATPGVYSVKLTVSNAIAEIASIVKQSYILVSPTASYAAFGGSDTSPYDSWAKAASNIQDAVDVMSDGGVVYVSNGTYLVTSAISVSKGITVVATNGSSVTTVQRLSGNTRLFGIGHVDAVVDGFTIKNGSAPTTADVGGGIYMTAGTLRNSTITNCAAVYGGGISMSGGLVTNCVFDKNPTKGGGGGSGRGGGINISGGEVVDCMIRRNTSVRAGAGVRITGGIVRNCTVIENTSGHGGGGFAMEGGGLVENCLIIDNNAGSFGGGGGGILLNNAACKVLNCTVVGNETTGTGGGIYRSNGYVSNSIVYYNFLTATSADDDISGTNNFGYSCSPDLSPGSGNITDIPQFKDKDNDDFTLDLGSPCIDSGATLAEIVNDLVGSSRPNDGDNDGTNSYDMGCYEARPFTGGVLSCNFLAPTNEAPISLTAFFTAIVSGANTNSLYYWWDFENDSIVDEEGSDKGSVSNTYASGYYTVKLTVSNAIAEVASKIKVEYIKVFPNATFVTTNGAHVNPYSNWGNAATNIQDAVDAVMEGGTVTVSNGTYLVSANISVTKGVTVRSVNGSTNTIVKRLSGTTRIFSVGHINAVVDGFTMDDGSGPVGNDNGGGVYMTAGTVMNCTITNCTAVYGGGIYMTGGTVTNCVLAKNPTKGGGGGSGQGGGIYATGGTIVDCIIRDGSSVRAGAGVRIVGASVVLSRSTISGNSDNWGGSVHVTAAALIRNCLITGNSGGSYSGGGGIILNNAGARVENCTVVGNTTAGVGGGIYRAAGVVSNSIFYYNTATVSGNDVSGTNNVVYSCASDMTHDPAGTGNITNAPWFVDAGGGYGLSYTNGDLRLFKYSPCIDAGTNAPWMTAGLDLDLEERILDKIVDMGAYENYVAPKGTMFIFR